jgi:hypothetical protein
MDQTTASHTLTDANGRLVVAGNGVILVGRVTSVDGVGNATILLSDSYDTLTSQRTTVIVPCYNVRQQITTAA